MWWTVQCVATDVNIDSQLFAPEVYQNNLGVLVVVGSIVSQLYFMVARNIRYLWAKLYHMCFYSTFLGIFVGCWAWSVLGLGYSRIMVGVLHI